MAELFGAPLGIMAADEQSRQNALVGLEAQKVMNTLALQPSQIALNQAHTGYYGAQTAEAQAKADAANVMQRLGAGFTEAQRLRQGVIDEKAAKGQIATVADQKGAGEKVSVAQPLKDFVVYAAGEGAPPTVLEKIYGEIATIEEKEAVGKWRTKEAAGLQDRMEREHRTEIGGIAAAAAASPAQYRAFMLNPDLQARFGAKNLLTGSYEADKVTLQTIAQASMDANKQADNRLQQAEFEARQANFNAGESKRNAQVAVADAQFLLAMERYQQLHKNGQALTDAGIAAKKAVTAAARARTAAAADKAAPQLPLDSKARVLNKSYTLPDGRTATWETDPATGRPGLNVRED